MNPDLVLVDEDLSCGDMGLSHIWLATVDAYGVEGAECERCGVLMGETE